MPKNDKLAALKALREEKVGVLSTASKKGEPWSSAIHFLVDQDFNFYFLTRKSTLKYRHVIENGQASLNVGLFCAGKNGNFQIFGKAARLHDASDWDKLRIEAFSQRKLNDLHLQAFKEDPFYSYKGRDFAMLILKPKYIRWLKALKGKATYMVLKP